MAAAAILNFETVLMIGLSNRCVGNIYLQTKFGANRLKIAFLRRHLGFAIPSFGVWTAHDVPIDGLYVP